MKTAVPFPPPGSRAPVCAALSIVLVLAAIVLRHPLTRTMTLHMLVHIPMVLAAGMLAARALQSGKLPMPSLAKALAVYRGFDECGVPGLLLASFAGAFWMIPRALDAVLLSVPMDVMKLVSLFMVGLVLHDALTRANVVIRLFFLGNFCWMAAVVGIVYQNTPSRLCNFYLATDQQNAGVALVALSICLPLAWLLCAWRRVRGFLRDA